MLWVTAVSDLNNYKFRKSYNPTFMVGTHLKTHKAHHLEVPDSLTIIKNNYNKPKVAA